MTMNLQSTGFTHVGGRRNNEDAHCVAPHLGLYAVADGMGGSAGGEVASHIAICTVTEFLASNYEAQHITLPFGFNTRRSFIENMLEAALHTAHRRVVERKTGELAGMGSTLSALVIREGKGIIAHVGDSRVYRLRQGVLEQLTKDHSLYEHLLAKGARVGPRRTFRYKNIITQAIGMPGVPAAHVTTVHVMPGDVYLLCTDGLSEVLPEYHMASLLRSLPPERACSELVHDAYEWGSRDNITAVIVRVLPSH